MQVHDGLVVDDPLLALDGPAKISLELQLVDRAPVHVRVEDFMAGEASSLGSIERGVGIAEHVVVARVARAGQRDADADRGEDLGPDDGEGQRHGILDALCHANRIALAVQIVEENRELIAHHPCQHVAWT